MRCITGTYEAQNHISTIPNVLPRGDPSSTQGYCPQCTEACHVAHSQHLTAKLSGVDMLIWKRAYSRSAANGTLFAIAALLKAASYIPCN
jgi:hypothetical protein